MKKLIYTSLMILIYLFTMMTECYACDQNPEVIIGLQRFGSYYLNVTETGHFCSLSYDPDDGEETHQGITAWSWYIEDEYNNEVYDDEGEGGGPHLDYNFQNAGRYEIYLWVQDNDNPGYWFGPVIKTVYVSEVDTPFWTFDGGVNWSVVQGPVVYVPVNQSVMLSVSGNPNSYGVTYFPSGSPIWTISPSGPVLSYYSSGFCEGGSSSDLVLVANFPDTSTYTLTAKAGPNDIGKSIDIKTIKVDLLINNTTAENDDYVVLEKSGDIRVTPMLRSGETSGATDNHIPMKIHLEGPTGFSCKVKLSDPGSGDITIKKNDGSTYSSEGETVTVGTDLEVKIYGTTASTNLNDVTITAKTDKTGDSICGQEDLTVIWISNSNMNFRGSGNQGDALTACSSATFTHFFTWYYDEVGKFVYPKSITGTDKDAAKNQMEINILPSPNQVISDVEWNIKREMSGVMWGPGTGTLPPQYKGQLTWADDDTIGDDDEDLTQCSNCYKIFVIDGPGSLSPNLSYTSNFRFSHKGKFREWVQIKIGDKWYVCSPYLEWRSIMHVKFQDASTGWIEDTSKTNEIVLGTISDFAGTWSEN